MMKKEIDFTPPRRDGDSAAEYLAVRDGGVGVLDFSSRGRIEVSGSEAEQFLNGLITNDVKTLEEKSWMSAALPNAQGRLLATVRVLRLAVDRFLFDTEAVTRDKVVKAFERFTFAGDFKVRDLTDETSQLSLQGARAAEIARELLGEEASLVKRGGVASATWNDVLVDLIRATHTAEDGFDLFIETESAAAVSAACITAGAKPINPEAIETLRIEAGLPRYGIDMDETNVVTEAIADDAVSFTKGCYVGQEIIARIHWRGHVAKKLTGLTLEAQEGAAPGDKITSVDGNAIGRITSTGFSPQLDQFIALGYVKYDFLAPGREVRVTRQDSALPARVTDLPFVRGSWYETSENGLEANS